MGLGPNISQQDKDRILELYDEKIPVKMIWQSVGRSYSGIQRIIYRNRKGNRYNGKRTQSIRKKISELNSAGLDDRDIAQRVNETPAVVRGIRIRAGIPAIRKRKDKALIGYKKACKTAGTFAERRWEHDRFEAFMLGAPTGITRCQFAVMRAIQELGEPTSRMIADSLGINSGTLRCRLKGIVRLGRVIKTIYCINNHTAPTYRLANQLELSAHDQNQLASRCNLANNRSGAIPNDN